MLLWSESLGKKMKCALQVLCLYIFGFYAVCTYDAECGPSEYLSAAGECCPMCNIGSVVYKDCSADYYSTECEPCSKGTFMNEPNGKDKCFPCKTCDTGLYILHDCTTIEDTVCEVLDGNYCVQSSRSECTHAVKHSKCQPGQQLKTPGTKTSDTVCEPCPPGFYSPEGVNCTKWTDCSVNNELQDQEGSSIKDVQCKPRRNKYALIPAFILVLLSVIILYLISRNCLTKLNHPVEETNPQYSTCTPSSSKQEEKQDTDSPAT